MFSSSLPVCSALSTSQSEALAVIHAQSFFQAWDHLEFERLLAQHNIQADGLFLNQILQGFILSRFILDEAEVLTFCIDQKIRNKGLGRQLLTFHMKKLNHQGVKMLHLEVEEDNKPACRLYEKLHFTLNGTREAYYQQPDGSRKNAIMMMVKLDDQTFI